VLDVWAFEMRDVYRVEGASEVATSTIEVMVLVGTERRMVAVKLKLCVKQRRGVTASLS
jgi:hypothetical protein